MKILQTNQSARFNKKRNFLFYLILIFVFFSFKNDFLIQANTPDDPKSEPDKVSGIIPEDINDAPGRSNSMRFESIDTNFVKRYAPVLHFHPDEGKQCCYPSAADDAYPRAKMGKTGKNKFPKTLEVNTPCYFEALYTEKGFKIKYWFWYNYNDYPTGPNIWGNHPGDWEYLEIVFERGKPSQYIFSNHTTVRTKTSSELSFKNNQVEVWVGKGSHANYESPKPKKIWKVVFFPDIVAQGGSTWYTSDKLVDIRNTTFCHENYLGDWGDGKKIFGPLSRMDK